MYHYTSSKKTEITIFIHVQRISITTLTMAELMGRHFVIKTVPHTQESVTTCAHLTAASCSAATYWK
jgi:hypothetical protein